MRYPQNIKDRAVKDGKVMFTIDYDPKHSSNPDDDSHINIQGPATPKMRAALRAFMDRYFEGQFSGGGQ